MKDYEKILKKLREIKPELEKSYFVKEIGVFGSYVRDEQREDSDIDVLVDFNKGISLFKFAEFINYLESLFDKKIDVANKKTLKPRIGKQILSEVVYV
jgi:uncharacterized protein